MDKRVQLLAAAALAVGMGGQEADAQNCTPQTGINTRATNSTGQTTPNFGVSRFDFTFRPGLPANLVPTPVAGIFQSTGALGSIYANNLRGAGQPAAVVGGNSSLVRFNSHVVLIETLDGTTNTIAGTPSINCINSPWTVRVGDYNAVTTFTASDFILNPANYQLCLLGGACIGAFGATITGDQVNVISDGLFRDGFEQGPPPASAAERALLAQACDNGGPATEDLAICSR